MTTESQKQNRVSRVTSLIHAIDCVKNAAKKREEREQLATKAKADIAHLYANPSPEDMMLMWKRAEEVAQMFREAHYSGEDGYRGKRIIDLVWEGVENNKVNVDRDREDNINYTGGHLKALQTEGIHKANQYEEAEKKLKKEYFDLTGKQW